MIDHDHLYRALCGFELQSGLLLKRGRERRFAGIQRDVAFTGTLFASHQRANTCLPASRCIEGVTLIKAFVRNLGT